MAKETSGHILVDLDGTLAKYTKWRGVTHIGEPIIPMLQKVVEWMDKGHPEYGTKDIRIFTARVAQDGTPQRAAEVKAARIAIDMWCEKNIGVPLPITCIKDMSCLAIYDDRAHRVEQNTGKILA